MSFVYKKIPKEVYDSAEKFMEKYGGSNFNSVKFRPGSATTDPFCLNNRYRTINGKVVWGYPGIHTGTDRGSSTVSYNNVFNPVYSPFDFVSSSFEDDGGTMYGTIISLYHESGFKLVINHMYPKEIIILQNLKEKKPVEANTLIGSAGNYGFSYGVHTHTDIESYDINIKDYTESSLFLDAILEIKYGQDIYKEYSEEEVLAMYAKCEQTKNWNKDICLKDYQKEVRQFRGVLFMNKYRYTFKNYSINKIYTRYGTKPLFDM